MKESNEKLISGLLDISGQIVAFFACLPLCISFIVGTYFLFNFFKTNNIMLPDFVWAAVGLGFAALIFVFLVFSMAIMNTFIKSFKELYGDIKKHKEERK